MSPKRRLLNCVGLVGALLCAGPAAAQAAPAGYPAKPITLILPSSAGSTLDMIARQVGERLTRRLGQPVIVENRAGASGIIAYDLVARAKPDGYTLGMVQASFVSNRFLLKAAQYDEFKDYTPVAMVARSPMVLIARQAFPASTVAQLREVTLASPGTVTYASTNGANQMNMELVRKALELDIRNVPYRDSAQAVTDVMAGHVDTNLAPYTVARPLVQSGKVKVFVTTGRNRLSALPDVPTASELGLPVDIHTWAGFVAPAGVPEEIVALLHEEIGRIAAQPDFLEWLTGAGYESFVISRPEFVDLMHREIATYAEVAQEIRIQPE